MTTSEGILKWMDENKDFFKPMGVCKKVGIDKGNFSRYKKEGSIPEKYLIPIMELITPLGFTLDEVIEDNNKHENKDKIEEARNPKGMSEMEREILEEQQRILNLKNK